MTWRPGALLVLVAASVSTAGAGCALNQRLMIERAPYGVSDLVFPADRQLEIKRCDGNQNVWAQLPLMFIAGREITRLEYRLDEQSAGDGEFYPVRFAYELHLLTKPEEADKKLTQAQAQAQAQQTRAPGVAEPMRQEAQQTQQKMVREATDAKRVARKKEEWRCEVTSNDKAVTFEGNRLLGKHMLALVAAPGGLHTGGHYRLTFQLPPTAPPPPPSDEMARVAAGGERTTRPGTPPPDDVIGRVELRMVKNSNLIGVPVGLGLIIGFLILTTAL
jgi:hypothetical protein